MTIIQKIVFSSMLLTSPNIIFADECIQSSIVSPTPFMGNSGELFKLLDGSVWEVMYEYNYLYKYYPNVIICPNSGKLFIGEKSLNVKLLSLPPSINKSKSGEWEVYEETNLEGSISGTIQQGHIFKTTSGSIYEVTGFTLQLVLELQPKVTVLQNGDTYKLVVKGFKQPVICKKLR